MLAALLLAAAGLVACGSGEEDSSAAGDKTLSIMELPGSIYELPLMVADDQGYFKEAGVSLKKLSFESAPAGVTAVLSGDLDIALINTAVQLATNVKATTDQKRIVQIVNSMAPTPGGYVASAGLGVDPNAPLRDRVRALKGKSIGVPSIGSLGQFIFEELLRWAGMKKTDVSFIAVGLGATSLAALINHQVDALYTAAPVYQQAVEAGAVPVWTVGVDKDNANLYPGLGANWVSSVGTATKKQEALTAFTGAVLKAKAFIQDPANTGKVAEIWHRANSTVPTTMMTDIIKRHRDRWSRDREGCDPIQNEMAYLRGTLLPADLKVDCGSLVWKPTTSTGSVPPTPTGTP